MPGDPINAALIDRLSARIVDYLNETMEAEEVSPLELIAAQCTALLATRERFEHLPAPPMQMRILFAAAHRVVSDTIAIARPLPNEVDHAHKI